MISPRIGSLTKADGTMTQIGEETSQEVLNKHFPECTDLKETRYDYSKEISLEEIKTRYITWINTATLKESLSSFKAKKSPGPDGFRPIIFKFLPHNII